MGRLNRVLVVGGGLAGLGTARALRARDIACDVVERMAGWQQSGTGLYLPANSVRALATLGLRTPLLERGRQIDRQRFLDERGRLLLEIDLPRFWGAADPCVALARRDLHEVLREGVGVRMNTTVANLRQEGGRVDAVLADGSRCEYDVVVGADGVRSRTRTAVLGGGEPHRLGQVSWRLLLGGCTEISAWTAWLGRGRTLLVVPLGDGTVYCYADLDTAPGTDPTGGDPLVLTELFGHFAEPVPTILAAALAAGRPPFFSPIEEVVQERWVLGRIALVGDAAHALAPNMAEGVGMGLEDGLVLAQTIAAGLPLEAFERRRRPRVEFVRAQTRRRDRMRRLPPALRNVALRIAGEQVFRAGYAPLRAGP